MSVTSKINVLEERLCLGSYGLLSKINHFVEGLDDLDSDPFWVAMLVCSVNGKFIGKLNQNTDILYCVQNGKGVNFLSLVKSREHLEMIVGKIYHWSTAMMQMSLLADSTKKLITMFSNHVSIYQDDDDKVSKK